MEFVIKISQFLLSLSLLIVLHELGHFIPARLFKTRVEKFYLFFDIKYSLFKKKIGDTVYGIGWLPLGGYVKIAGMIDESMDKEQMALPPQPWEFRSKPAWQRLIIMLGGVTVNVILAVFIYIGTSYYYGDQFLPNENIPDGILIESTVLNDIGIKTGDKIVAVDDFVIEDFMQIFERVLFGKQVTIERNGELLTVDLPQDFLSQISDAKEKRFVALRMPFIINEVPDSSYNKSAGLRKGDIITALNDTKTKYADQVIPTLQDLSGQTVTATVLRDQTTFETPLTISDDGKIGLVYALGATPETLGALGYYDFEVKEYSFLEAIPVGFVKTKEKIGSYIKQFKAIFTPSTGAYKEVGGFKAIYDVFPSVWSWEYFWGITAFLSIMLAVLNLLPIPALDGGHVMFLLYEILSRRTPSEKFLERPQVVGFLILIMLVWFANGNDIFKAITN